MHTSQFLQQRTGIDDQTERGETLTPLLNMYKAQMQFCVFLGLSSNARYQIINSLEHVLEQNPNAFIWLRWRLRLESGFLIMYMEVCSLWIG
ncbi:unnamed protein product, partial [Brassica napus]